jgi:transcriptional regulator with XRE-family HTH domain
MRQIDRVARKGADRVRVRLVEDLDRLAADAGISHAALARGAGVSPGFLADIFAGKVAPSLETYAKLAVPLGADLSARIYPNTGPKIRDRHQARILEALLAALHPRWRAYSEVAVIRPGRGWIDAAMHDARANLVVATEIESDLRRIEQTVRWSREKAESLPSWAGWSRLTSTDDPDPAISKLLVVRRTATNRATVSEFAQQLALAYPAHPEDALASLLGSAPWPGQALVWARMEPTIRFLPARGAGS